MLSPWSHLGNHNHTAIMAMRVYALYEKSRLILITLVIVAVGVLGFGLVRPFF